MQQLARAVATVVRHGCHVLGTTHKFSDGKFILPGGKVDPGETTLEAAKRETREETGIEVFNARLVMEAPTCFEALYKESGGQLWWTSMYVTDSWLGSIKAEGGQEVKWCTWDELLAGPLGSIYRELRSRL